MRIVHITDYFHPLLGYQGVVLPRVQAKMGHEVYMLTSDRYSPRVYTSNRKLLGGNRVVGAGLSTEEGVKVLRLKTRFEASIYPWMVGLEQKIRELRPDVVYTAGIANFTGIRLARLKEKWGKFVLVYYDGMTWDNSNSKLRLLYPVFRWTFARQIARSADAIVGIVPETREFLNRKCGIPEDKVEFIPLGADDELFRHDETARREVRRELSINDDELIFIYTGKITPYKRLELLIEAAVKLVKYDKVKILVVGSGAEEYVSGLMAKVRLAGLENRFIWHDAVPNKELYRYYSAADVAVWPRGASISQREAMSCGLPLVLSQGGAVDELVSNGNGLLFEKENASDLARQMEKLLDRDLRVKMGAASRKCVKEKYSYKVVARRFIDVALS